MQVLEGIW